MDTGNVHRLHIPVLKSPEVVSIHLDHLPNESDEVVEVLKAEEAPVGIWMDLALAYLSQGSPDQYVHILQEACSKEADEFYGDKFRAERVEVLCCLAGYHLCKAQHLRDPSRKSELATAESYGIRARNLDKREMLSFLCLGMVAMARGDLSTAKREFEVSVTKKNRGKPNAMPYVGLASVYFHEGKYSEALAYYKHVLQLLGSANCPPDIRNGMAACYFRLGKFAFAKKAFLRTLQLHPDDPEALRGLAVVILRANQSGDQSVLEEARDLLVRAYNTDPYDPATVVIVCHLFLLKGLYESATDLAKVACETAVQDNIKAEALTLLARSWHARDHFAEACRFYAHAQKVNSSLPLPHFGLAQYYVSANEIRNAVTELENMLRGMPGSVDALKLLCRLYPYLPSKSSEKLQIIQDAGQRQHTDPHVWAVLGELMGPLDAKGSLDAYRKALEAFGEVSKATSDAKPNGMPSRQSVPMKVLNDAAVMFSRAGEHAQALKLIQEALSKLEAGDQKDSPYPKYTLKYNLGRISEASDNVKGAAAIYKEILDDEPMYMDAYIRLAYICQHQGNTFEALKWCTKALEKHPGDPTATVVKAGMYILESEWHEAKDLLDSIVKGACSNDPYALLCMGTLNISSAPVERKKDRDKDTATTHYMKALEYYVRAIDNCKQNIYAANGIGAALAEMGDLSTAREVFVQVQEAAASQGKYLEIPSIWVNLANIHLAFGDYDRAIQVYENALARFYKHSDPTLLVYLARAHYDKGNLADAKAALLKAEHLVPNDFSLKFNLALVMQEHGVRTLDKKNHGDDIHSVEECRKAGEDVARALTFFSALRKAGQETTSIDSKKLGTHITFCSDALRRSKHVREEVEARYQVAEGHRKKSRMAREDAERRHREQDEEKQRVKEQEEAWKADAVRKQMAKVERLKQSWKEDAELKKAAKKGDSSRIGRKRKMKTDADGFIVHGDEVDAAPKEIRRKKKGKDGDHYPTSTQQHKMNQSPQVDMDTDDAPHYSQDALAAAGLLSDNSGDEGSEQIGDHTQPMDLSDDNLQSGGPHDDAQRDHFRIPDE